MVFMRDQMYNITKTKIQDIGFLAQQSLYTFCSQVLPTFSEHMTPPRILMEFVLLNLRFLCGV